MDAVDLVASRRVSITIMKSWCLSTLSHKRDSVHRSFLESPRERKSGSYLDMG